MSGLRVARKWRPRLSLVVAALVLILLALPVAGLIFARLAENQFVRETEQSLIAQAAIMAEVYAEALEAAGAEEGLPLSEEAAAARAEQYRPVAPVLVAHPSAIRPAEAGVSDLVHPPLPVYATVAPRLRALAEEAQRTTLAGYRFTDATGQVIATSGADLGTSLASLPEVRAALEGSVGRVLRYRQETEPHALGSISRDTAFRVHVAHPVIVGDRIMGAVQVTRTPVNLRKFLYGERGLLGRMAAVTIGGAALLGFVFWRFVSRPIQALRAQSHAVATGLRPAPEPLRHYGVAELADLGQSVLSMAQTLTERSEALRTYTDHVTHELKSPVTAIVGAAELLEDAGADPARSERLRRTIADEALRMDRLLARLRELARIRTLGGAATAPLGVAVEALKARHPGLAVTLEAPQGAEAPLSPEELDVVLTQLAQNAAEHGATAFRVAAGPGDGLTIRDDGIGISKANRGRVFDPFFTTRREGGGTGMGLSIVAAVVQNRGGRIELGWPADGTEFRISFAG